MLRSELGVLFCFSLVFGGVFFLFVFGFFPFSIGDANIKRLFLQRTSCCYLNGNYFSPGLAPGLVNLAGSSIFILYCWYYETRV